MIINWNGETVDCRIAKVAAGAIRVNDYVLYHGELCKVITVQQECYSIHNLHRFTQFTLVARDGSLNCFSGDEVIGKREVFKAKRKAIR